MSRFALLSSTACLLAGAVIGASIAYAAQPHMANAFELLKAAHTELERATSNKGGHRERALQAVDKAMQETRAGVDYAGN